MQYYQQDKVFTPEIIRVRAALRDSYRTGLSPQSKIDSICDDAGFQRENPHVSTALRFLRDKYIKLGGEESVKNFYDEMINMLNDVTSPWETLDAIKDAYEVATNVKIADRVTNVCNVSANDKDTYPKGHRKFVGDILKAVIIVPKKPMMQRPAAKEPVPVQDLYPKTREIVERLYQEKHYGDINKFECKWTKKQLIESYGRRLEHLPNDSLESTLQRSLEAAFTPKIRKQDLKI